MQIAATMSHPARCRARRRNGLAVFQIEADTVGLIEALKVAGLLDPSKEDDRAAIKQALQRAIEIFVLENTL
jgi:hypothetical protein